MKTSLRDCFISLRDCSRGNVRNFVEPVLKLGIVLALLMSTTACTESVDEDRRQTPDVSVSDKPHEFSEAEVTQIHRAALVLDAHADIEIIGSETRYVGADGRSQVEPTKMAAGDVDAVVMAIAVGPGSGAPDDVAQAQSRAKEELMAVQQLVEDESNNLVLATSPEILESAHQQGRRALILGFQNARILGGQVEALDQYYADGVRVFALTHMGHNDFADSSRPVFVAELGRHEPDARHGGLSELGRAAIERLNNLGAIIDVSQISSSALKQVLVLTRAPIIASHSNVQALTDVRRNLTDAEIDAIAANGGVIHIAAFRGYLFDSNDAEMDAVIRQARRVAGIIEDYDYPFELYWEIDDPEVQQTYLNTVSEIIGPGSVDAMLNHLDYVVERVGIDHVGIGNDFNHGSGIQGFADASEAKNITQALLQRGYSAQDVNKIWGGNFMRVWREVEASRSEAE